jgi:hypothetical protein
LTAAELFSVTRFNCSEPSSLDFERPAHDPGFVDLIYENVMGRRGDASGVTYWNGILEGGTPPGTVILSFTESAEFKLLTKTS